MREARVRTAAGCGLVRVMMVVVVGRVVNGALTTQSLPSPFTIPRPLTSSATPDPARPPGAGPEADWGENRPKTAWAEEELLHWREWRNMSATGSGCNAGVNVTTDDGVMLVSSVTNSSGMVACGGAGQCGHESEEGVEACGGGGEAWRQCPHLAASPLVRLGFLTAVSRGQQQCARFWCQQVEGSEEREQRGGVYHVVRLGYVAEEDHHCLLNLTRMVVLHHSWPMCASDFICATNDSTFAMSAADCMPRACLVAESAVLVFMLTVSVSIVAMSLVIMAVIVARPQFQKPKYYLRFSLAATDFFIGMVVCGHAAYNQWVGLTEVPMSRFLRYGNLKAGQLFRHVPNCLWGVSDTLTQISGFFVASNMIISLFTLSLMSLDRYLLLTRTRYRSLVTSRRVAAALVVSWGCGFVVPSLHFVYRPQKQHDICVNYDTSSLDVHIINNESKIATADYKVYLKHTVPLAVTMVVLGLPIVALLVFSFRTLRKYNRYTRDQSVRRVKSALQLTQTHQSLSRQASTTSLAAVACHSACSHGLQRPSLARPASPPYKLKFTFNKRKSEVNETSFSSRECEHASGSAGGAGTGGVAGVRSLLTPTCSTDNVTATLRRLRSGLGVGVGVGGAARAQVRDREITCTVLVNVAVFSFACFPLLAVGGWMMFLYFTQQEVINNRPPLKQLLFLAPWMMALNSLWNPLLHLTYNHKFRTASIHLLGTALRRLWWCRPTQEAL